MLAFIDITDRVRAEHDIRTARDQLNVAEQAERQRISKFCMMICSKIFSQSRCSFLSD